MYVQKDHVPRMYERNSLLSVSKWSYPITRQQSVGCSTFVTAIRKSWPLELVASRFLAETRNRLTLFFVFHSIAAEIAAVVVVVTYLCVVPGHIRKFQLKTK